MERRSRDYTRSVVGIFRRDSDAREAVDKLKGKGFRGDDITISSRDESMAERMAGDWDIIHAGAAAKWLGDHNILIGVECRERCDDAWRILSEAGGEVRWARIRAAEAARPAQPAMGTRETREPSLGREREERPFEGQVMPVREEELDVRKRRHKEGEVEVTKHVVEEQRTMHVPVRHDHVEIERRRIHDGETQSGPEEGTVDIPIYEEEVIIEKRPRLVEEIRIRKQPVTEEREVRETIRKEVPEVHRKGDVHEHDVRESRSNNEESRREKRREGPESKERR